MYPQKLVLTVFCFLNRDNIFLSDKNDRWQYFTNLCQDLHRDTNIEHLVKIKATSNDLKPDTKVPPYRCS